MKSFRTTNTGDEPIIIYDHCGSSRELQPGESFERKFEEPAPIGQVDPLAADDAGDIPIEPAPAAAAPAPAAPRSAVPTQE